MEKSIGPGLRPGASRVQLTEYLASARVTLSLAPLAKASSTRRRAALFGIGILGEYACDLGFGQLIGQAVGAEQQDIAIGQGAAVDFHVDACARAAHDIGDDVPARMGASVFGVMAP